MSKTPWAGAAAAGGAGTREIRAPEISQPCAGGRVIPEPGDYNLEPVAWHEAGPHILIA